MQQVLPPPLSFCSPSGEVAEGEGRVTTGTCETSCCIVNLGTHRGALAPYGQEVRLCETIRLVPLRQDTRARQAGTYRRKGTSFLLRREPAPLGFGAHDSI